MRRIFYYTIRCLILFALLSFVANSALAVPAKRTVSTVILPDGTSTQATLMGDEFFHYWKTQEGLRLKKDGKGAFAIMDEEEFLLLNQKAQAKHACRRKLYQQETITQNEDAHNTSPRRAGANKSPRGTQRVLVILVQFTDVKFLKENTKEAFLQHINGDNYKGTGYGSARDYFIAQSDSLFQPQFDIYGPYTASHEMAYYGGNDDDGNDKAAAQLIAEACKLANGDVDYTIYDSDNNGVVDFCYVIYAGYGEAQGGGDDTIWPHQWAIQWGTGSPLKLDGVIINEYACSNELKGTSSTRLDGIGTICHEFGHCLGLPDFYPTDDSNNYGMSWWSIMDAGCYNEDGYTPAAYTAYERDFLGWKKLITLYSEQRLVLKPLDQGGFGYKIESDYNSNEYIIIENIQQSGWNRAAYGHGMMATHVLYNKSAWESNTVNNGKLQHMTIIPADDNTSTRYVTDLAGDLYPGPTNNTELSNYSTPSMRTHSGLYFNKPLTEIEETNGIVYATFMEGSGTSTLALDATDVTSYSFTAHWEALEDINEYSLEVYHITGGYNSSADYNLSLITTNGEQQQVIRSDINESLVTNLEAKELYCYRVRCIKDSKASAPSNPIFVYLPAYSDSLGIPKVSKPYDISPNGFRISWNSVPDAKSYIVETFSDPINQGSQPDNSVLLKEDFSTMRSVYGNVSRVMDIYTSAPDWRGNEVYAQAGYILLGSKTETGYLLSPFLAQNIGYYTVSFAARKYSSDDEQPMLYILMGSDADSEYYVAQARLAVVNTEWKTYTVELGPISTNTYLLFTTTASGDDTPRVCLDNVKVTWTDGSEVKNSPSNCISPEMELLGKKCPTQQKVSSPRKVSAQKHHIEVTDTFYQFTALETAVYTFRVRAVGDSVYSPYSISQSQEIINSYIESDGIAYNYLDQEARLLTVTSLNNQRKYEGHIVIPEKVQIEGITHEVASISTGAFFACPDLLSVTVPKSIREVGKSLFCGCRNLCYIDWYASVALTDSQLTGCNPQLLLFDFSGTCSGCSLPCVVKDGHAESLTVYLNYPFLNPRPFTVGHIQYSKDFSQHTYIGSASGWETVVLPFDVQRIENETKGVVTPFGDESSEWHIWLGTFNGTSFQQASAIKSNVPCIVSCPYSDGYDPGHTISGALTFSADNAVVEQTTDVPPVEGSLFRFVPVYKKIYKSPSIYVLNTYDYSKEGTYAGSEFQPDVMSLRTFGAYMEQRSSSAPSIFRIGNLPSEEKKAADTVEEPLREDIYSISGQLIRKAGEQGSSLAKGIYIQGGKKIIVH
ncbi:MAG: M6 family metalloprotease domain-containing protein [Bacteroidaceae bacterium]|nr:M6 family metalloprotease domain-containing protein [Bacteroidaceae bacterium]